MRSIQPEQEIRRARDGRLGRDLGRFCMTVSVHPNAAAFRQPGRIPRQRP